MNARERSKLAKDLVRELGEVDTTLDVNLLLTRRCNFACAHCMYASSPRMPVDYMSFDDIEQIIAFGKSVQEYIEVFQDSSVNLTFNVVGGEPTLDLDRFEAIMQQLETANVMLDMTSNGWWLFEATALRRVIRALRPVLDTTLGSLRISSSPWHDKFRTEQQARMLHSSKAFQCAFSEDSIDMYYDLAEDGWNGLCDCDAEIPDDRAPDKPCPGCGETRDDLRDRYTSKRLPYSDWSWLCEKIKAHEIYVDATHHESGAAGVSPVGRGRKLIGAAQDGPCRPLKFTFMPGATIYDVCCNGGHAPMGHARDGVRLFFRRMLYIRALLAEVPEQKQESVSLWGGDTQSMRRAANPLQGERCRQCPGIAAKWLRTQAPELEEVIDAAMEIIDSKQRTHETTNV